MGYDQRHSRPQADGYCLRDKLGATVPVGLTTRGVQKNSRDGRRAYTPVVTEAQLQRDCVKWFRLQYPLKVIFAIPNGGSRDIREAYNLKRSGVLAGVPDLFIPEPIRRGVGETFYSPGLFIEMKSETGRVSAAQNEVMAMLKDRGYRVEVVNGFDAFRAVVSSFLDQDGGKS